MHKGDKRHLCFSYKNRPNDGGDEIYFLLKCKKKMFLISRTPIDKQTKNNARQAKRNIVVVLCSD